MISAKPLALVVCILSLAIPAAPPAHADNAGELFPNVKAYEETVPAPVSKPERSIARPAPKVEPAIPTTPPITPSRPPEATPTPPVPPATPPKPAAPELWSPYRRRLFEPLMSPESQARFDKEYAPRIATILKDKDTAAEADQLWNESKTAALAPDLRRAVMLHALGVSILGRSSLDARAPKARELLPMLTEDTLPVAQARADAVTQLAFGDLAKASPDLLTIVIESQCKLARMQVQAGFPLEAKASLAAARDAYGYILNKTDEQRDTIAEAAGWVDRAAGALAASTRYKQTLATTPADPFANTQIAVLNLSLYGDVESAAHAAAKSDRKELKAIAAATDKVRQPSPDPAATLALCTALLDFADTGIGQTFDRYSIATLAQARLSNLAAESDFPPDQKDRLPALQSRATLIIARSGFKLPPFHALAAFSGAADPAAASQPAKKLVLFVESSGTIVKYVKPTPREEAEALAMERKLIQDSAAKIDRKLVELETAHCLVYTNLPPARHAYFKSLVEAAYAAAAKQYDFPLNENVFAAKLPILFLADSADFAAFAKATDHPWDPNTVGYTNITPEGIGYISVRNMTAAEATAAGRDPKTAAESTMAWNMTVMFAFHYRTNRALPNWMTVGIAERVADSFYPLPERAGVIRGYAAQFKSIADMLAKDDRPNQAVSMSIVNTLMARDPRAFKNFIDKLKDGTEPEAALKVTYKWSFTDLDQAWKLWVSKTLNGGK